MGVICPNCGLAILEHPANDCLDRLVAVHVMGWVWYDEYALWVVDNDVYRRDWHPSTSRADMLDALEKTIADLSVHGAYGGERNGRCSIYMNRTRAYGFDSLVYQVCLSRSGGKDKINVSCIGDDLCLTACRAMLLARMPQ